jgi:type II secretory pathway pseudopilin PulG
LLVVLVILAITAAAAVPAFLSASLATPEQKTATALASVLSSTRDAARESGAPATLTLSPTDGRYWLATRDSVVTGVLPLTGATRLIAPSGERAECRFSPTGSASALSITVHGTNDFLVRVEGWSGDISIGSARAS